MRKLLNITLSSYQQTNNNSGQIADGPIAWIYAEIISLLDHQMKQTQLLLKLSKIIYANT